MGKEKEITIVDSINRVVTVKKPVNRLICLGSYRTEAVKIIGAKDKIVGISTDILKYEYYYPNLLDKPLIGTWSAPDHEAIISVHPDIVITSANKKRALALEEKLKPFGITVIGLDFYRDYLLESEIEKLGYILDKNDEAWEYLDWRENYKSKIKEFVDGLTEDEKPRVFSEWGSAPISTEIRSYGKGSSGDYTCTAAGGRNICGELKQYPIVDSEWVIKENPDVTQKQTSSTYLIWGWYSTEGPKKLISDVITIRAGWDKLAAVENNRFYVYSHEISLGPDSIVGSAYYVKWYHPESELDIDPVDIYKEYLERFMSVEYPEDLIVAYPPPTS